MLDRSVRNLAFCAVDRLASNWDTASAKRISGFSLETVGIISDIAMTMVNGLDRLLRQQAYEYGMLCKIEAEFVWRILP